MQKLMILSAAIVIIACNNNSEKKGSKKDTAKAVEQIPAKPALPDTIFSGFGTEPFWSVYVIAGRKIVFHAADGPDIEVPYVPADSSDSIQYHSASGPDSIGLIIMKKECSDGMSETIHPYQIMVRVNKKNYSGCGRPGK